MACCCASLLLLQLAGLHLHASPHPENAGLHASHVHHADPDGHDHGEDVDVAVFELGALWAKLGALLFSIVALLPAATILAWVLPRPPDSRPRRRFLLYWRPPLRAPPATT